MTIKNKLMQSIISNSTVKVGFIDSFLISIRIKKYLKKIKKIKNCLVLQKPTFDINDYKKFNMYFGDETGFECSQNEINLNSTFKRKSISKEFAIAFFNNFNKELKYLYKGTTFCSIMSLDNKNNWVFRFHIIRSKNDLWINENIETYAEPIMYEIF